MARKFNLRSKHANYTINNVECDLSQLIQLVDSVSVVINYFKICNALLLSEFESALAILDHTWEKYCEIYEGNIDNGSCKITNFSICGTQQINIIRNWPGY